jgi:type IV pilus assembly protein PilB
MGAEYNMKRKKLGEILVSEGVITDYQLVQALGHQKQYGATSRLGSELIRRGFIGEEDLCYALQIQLKIKWLALHDITIDQAAVDALDIQLAKKYTVMPVTVDDKELVIATMDPTDIKTHDTIEFTSGKKVKPVIATSSDIRWAIARYYEGIKTPAPQKTRVHIATPPAESYTNSESAIEALIRLLKEKGLLTVEELTNIVEKLK